MIYYFLKNRKKKINREKKNIIEYPVKPKIEILLVNFELLQN